MRTQSTCPKCGQVDEGQTGEYPCPACGLPTTHDAPLSEVERLRSRLEKCRAACERFCDQSDRVAALVGYEEGEISEAVRAWGEKRFAEGKAQGIREVRGNE